MSGNANVAVVVLTVLLIALLTFMAYDRRQLEVQQPETARQVSFLAKDVDFEGIASNDEGSNEQEDDGSSDEFDLPLSELRSVLESLSSKLDKATANGQSAASVIEAEFEGHEFGSSNPYPDQPFTPCGLKWDIGPRGPVIISGVGDSGTRGVRLLIEEATGYDMCPQDRCNKAGDNQMMFKFNLAALMKATNGSVAHSRTSIPPSIWKEWQAKFCEKASGTAIREHPVKVQHGMWGFKNPHLIYYLPLIFDQLGSKFRFVHVMRDGRDLTLGDNQAQFKAFCRHNETCELSVTEDRMKFWEQVNMQVFHMATKYLPKESYTVLRIEDVVCGPTPTQKLKELMDFLGVSRFPEDLQAVIDHNAGHEGSYCGNKYTGRDAKKYLRKIGDAGSTALQFFGYSTETWGLSNLEPPYLAELKGRK